MKTKQKYLNSSHIKIFKKKICLPQKFSFFKLKKRKDLKTPLSGIVTVAENSVEQCLSTLKVIECIAIESTMWSIYSLLEKKRRMKTDIIFF